MDLKKIKFYLLIYVLLIGFVQCFATRYSVDPDGVSYLDVGRAYFNGDPQALNSYWSPLFSWIQGFVLFITNPPGDIEPIIVHIVNFFIFIFAYFCFLFFLNTFIQLNKLRQETLNNNLFLIPEWLWIVLGNALFLFSSTNLMTLSILTPDLLVSGMVYLMYGLLIKLKLSSEKNIYFIFLGIVVALAYYAKAFMFPLSILFFIISIFTLGNFKNTIPRIFTSTIIFILISSPYIYLLSKQEGHLTFGESGKLNYAWYVNETYEYWRGGWTGNKSLIHPSRKINDEPLVYEFAEPIHGSYPYWYQPAYWFQGLKPYFNLKGQIVISLRSLGRYYKMFINLQGILITVFIFLFVISMWKKNILKNLKETWYFLALPIAAIMAYSLVAVEHRYLGGLNVILWIGLFASLKFINKIEIKNYINVSILILSFYLIGASCASEDFIKNGKNYSALTQNTMSESIKKLGLKDGDKIGAIGLLYGIYWVRLAHLQIAAEIPDEEVNVFWNLNSEERISILNNLKKYNIKMAIAENPSSFVESEGWVNIKDTPYYVYDLRKDL